VQLGQTTRRLEERGGFTPNAAAIRSSVSTVTLACADSIWAMRGCDVPTRRANSVWVMPPRTRRLSTFRAMTSLLPIAASARSISGYSRRMAAKSSSASIPGRFN
jgi:hypothetical protein